jgi:hypothetical protein
MALTVAISCSPADEASGRSDEGTDAIARAPARNAKMDISTCCASCSFETITIGVGASIITSLVVLKPPAAGK